MITFKEYLKEAGNIQSKATNKYIGMNKSKLKELLSSFQNQVSDLVRKKNTFGGKTHDAEIAKYENLVKQVQYALKAANMREDTIVEATKRVVKLENSRMQHELHISVDSVPVTIKAFAQGKPVHFSNVVSGTTSTQSQRDFINVMSMTVDDSDGDPREIISALKEFGSTSWKVSK